MRVLTSALVLAGLVLGLTASSSALTPSVTEQNKAIVRGATDAMNARQYSVLSDYFAPDMIDHDPYPGQVPGLAGFVQGLVIKYSAFPDWVNINDEMIKSCSVGILNFRLDSQCNPIGPRPLSYPGLARNR